MYYYLPSCKFTAACPQASRKIRKYLKEKKGIVITGCCRQTQQIFQKGDIVLTVCLSCSAITKEVSPFVRELSVFEYLLQDTEFPWPDYHGVRITVQDCWRAQKNLTLKNAVRACMKRMNIQVVELDDNSKAIPFDGVWLMNPMPENNLKIAPHYFGSIERNQIKPVSTEEQKHRMQQWVERYTTTETAVYCNSCLKGIQLGGGHGIHLMELLVRNLPPDFEK